MNAEAAYLFRHAVMRDAAYQLHMPGARAKLHGLVLAILEDLFAGDPGMLDANAAEMADHARDALLGAHDGHDAAAQRAISAKELEYCRRAAGVARRTFQIDESVRLCVRVAAHPLASHEVAALALSDAPFEGPTATIRVGRVHTDNGVQLVVNKKIKNVKAHNVYATMIYKALDFTP